jgi:hypothetical protein
MNQQHRHWSFFVVALIAAGCGDGDKGGADGPSKPADAAGKTDTPVVVDTAPPKDTGGTPDAGVDASPDGPPPKCGPYADGGMPPEGGMPVATTSFFVTSDKSMTGNLGGLTGADTRCQTLAAAAGLGSKTWHAYLSVEKGPGNTPVNAKDRIGTGPWFNARGVMVAADLASLHTRTGDALVFVDEHGNLINGQWTGSPTPNEHDILTGSNADGTVATGKTCSDWTSMMAVPDGGVDGGPVPVARVGHTDGFGGNCNTATSPNNLPSWNSSHDNGGCNDTAPRGGAGRIYCFAIN